MTAWPGPAPAPVLHSLLQASVSSCACTGESGAAAGVAAAAVGVCCVETGSMLPWRVAVVLTLIHVATYSSSIMANRPVMTMMPPRGRLPATPSNCSMLSGMTWICRKTGSKQEGDGDRGSHVDSGGAAVDQPQ